MKSLLFFLLCLMSLGLAANKADFSGKWTLDKDRSFSNPAGLDQTMTITHAGDQVKLEAVVKTARGQQTVNESYTLDGKEADFKPAAPPNATGKRKASWLPGGRGVLIEDQTSVDGKVLSEVKRKWTLSADGKTMTVDYFIDETRGGNAMSYESKRVFNKIE
jgi:hypothetical protein